MQEQLIKISKTEWEGMKQTIEILQSPNIMNQIIESENNIKNNNTKELEI